MNTPDNDVTRRGNILTVILEWLTSGYPEGVPAQDRFALLALMRPRLTDDQIRTVVDRILTDSGDPTRAEAEELITRLTDERPSDADLERVRRHLAGVGVDLDWGDPEDDAA